MRSPESTVVRRATSSDIDTLVELMHEFYAESSYSLDRRWAADGFSQLLRNPALGGLWLAEHGDAVAGHAVLTVRYTMEHGALSAHIDDLFVRPQFRRRGIGLALLTELVAECRQRDCKALYVEVGERNQPAIELYRRIGLAPFSDGRVLLHGAVSEHAGVPGSASKA